MGCCISTNNPEVIKVKDMQCRHVIRSSSNSKIRNCKKHWQKYANKSFGKCCVQKCKNKAIHGAHVQLTSKILKTYNGEKWYIVPTCQKHNPRSANFTFKIKKNTIAVSDETVLLIQRYTNDIIY